LAFEAVRSRGQFGTQAPDRSALLQHVFLGRLGYKNLKFCIVIEHI